MIELNGKQFSLCFDIGTIERIEEKLSKTSLMSLIANSSGILPVAVVRTCLALALIDEDNKRLPYAEGNSYATQIIQKSYPTACQIVVFALQRDCPTFFQSDSSNLSI